jgi:molybdopterin molybdotransferase
MPEFLQLTLPERALEILIEALPVRIKSETLPITAAAGRVTAQAIRADQAVPAFPRSTVDGYAVCAVDTFGASDSNPAYLQLAGEIQMGQAGLLRVSRGQAILIHTGGMLPENADAVVMLEVTQVIGEMVEVARAVAVGENVIRSGEDVQPGEIVISAGRRLRPPEIGGLAVLGITEIQVACRPKVGIISSGDEVVPAEFDPSPGQVRDANTYSLGALIQHAGGEPVRYGIIPDSLEALEKVAEKALAECDMVVFTAGSSASARDLTAQVINHLGRPGVLVHGINFRPGKPTILAVCQGKAVIGLPGNPVSALVVGRLFLVPVIERLLGMPGERPRPNISAILTANVPSQAGREDWVPVRLSHVGENILAEPIFSKSNLIFSLVRADGLARIPPDATGMAVNDQVWVLALD